MKVFFDTEFTGLHKNTTLISIGCAAEDGSTFYAELTDYDKSQCDDWIQKNVISHLKFNGENCGQNDGQGHMEICGTKEQVKDYLMAWLSKYNEVQLVSDVCHYDMVLLIDLFGTAFDLPKGVNAACHDINQDIAEWFNISEEKAFDYSREGILIDAERYFEGDKHNALYDAKVIKEIYQYINA